MEAQGLPGEAAAGRVAGRALLRPAASPAPNLGIRGVSASPEPARSLRAPAAVPQALPGIGVVRFVRRIKQNDKYVDCCIDV